MLQRMTVAHQLGDALRGRGLLVEADQYYLDVLDFAPRDTRNIADMLKTYCLGKTWQQAQEFLYRVALNNPTSRWDADVIIHATWLLVGGAKEVSVLDGITLNRVLKLRQRPFPKFSLAHYRKLNKAHREKLFSRSVEYLDYALYMRPRTTKAWRQTDWFAACIETLSTIYNLNSEVNKTTPNFDKTTPNIEFLVSFLALRIKTILQNPNLFTTKNEIQAEWEEFKKDVSSKLKLSSKSEAKVWELGEILESKCFKVESQDNTQPENNQSMIEKQNHKELKQIDLINLTKTYNLKEKTLSDIREKIFEVTNSLYNLWSTTSIKGNLKEKKAWTNPIGRVHFDAYLQLTMLTARLLAECQLYEILQETSHQVINDMENFMKDWQNKYKYAEGEEPIDGHEAAHFTFSPYVFRYQFVTMLSWNGFANLQILHSPPIFSSQIHNSKINQSIQEARESLAKAQNYIPIHPLFMFAKAQLLAFDGLYPQAIETLKNLLSVIESFDPKQDIGTSLLEKPSPTSDKNREHLYYLEQVSGRQQFHNIVNPTTVQKLISQYANSMGEQERAIHHLSEAIRATPQHNLSPELFVDLIEQLITLERYGDAEAITYAMRIPRSQMKEIPPHLKYASDVLEAIINSRQLKHSRSLKLAKELAYKFQVSIVQPIELKTKDSKKINEKHDEVKRKIKEVFGLKAIHISSKDFKFSKLLSLVIKEKQGDVSKILSVFNQLSADQGTQNVEHPSATGNKLSKLDDMIEWAKLALSVDFINLDKSEEKGSNEKKITTQKEKQTQYNNALIMLEHLIQIAEICNTLAYSRAETSVGEASYANVDSLTALVIVLYLYSISDIDNPIRLRLKTKIAQYCDTCGWVEYKLSNPKLSDLDYSEKQPSVILKMQTGIKKAEHFLSMGLRYNPSLALLHYHLAYIYLEAVESIIHSNKPDLNSTVASPIYNEHLLFIDSYLERAETELANAKREDRFERIQIRIRKLSVWYQDLEKQAHNRHSI